MEALPPSVRVLGPELFAVYCLLLHAWALATCKGFCQVFLMDDFGCLRLSTSMEFGGRGIIRLRVVVSTPGCFLCSSTCPSCIRDFAKHCQQGTSGAGGTSDTTGQFIQKCKFISLLSVVRHAFGRCTLLHVGEFGMWHRYQGGSRGLGMCRSVMTCACVCLRVYTCKCGRVEVERNRERQLTSVCVI